LQQGFGVRFLVLHDFDKSGFSIVGTLHQSTERFRFVHPPEIIDLGLRLADIQAEKLESEPVYYRERNPSENLRRNGATQKEIYFLVNQQRRVELNALDNDHLLDWLERKLKAHGVEKIIPGEDVLVDAYRRATCVHFVNKRIDEAEDEAKSFAETIPIPGDLQAKIAEHLRVNPADSWDAAVARLVTQHTDEFNDGNHENGSTQGG
jgi:hypothetical protein